MAVDYLLARIFGAEKTGGSMIEGMGILVCTVMFAALAFLYWEVMGDE